MPSSVSFASGSSGKSPLPEGRQKAAQKVCELPRRSFFLRRMSATIQHWESQVADKRIHGTTRKQVAACFEQERPHLQPLPDSVFPCFEERGPAGTP